MNDTIHQLLQRPQGLWKQGLGSLKRSAGSLLHRAQLEHAGRRQELTGMVLRHGGISREEAQRVVGSFSEPASGAAATAASRPSLPSPQTTSLQPDLDSQSPLQARRPHRVGLHRS